MNVSRSERTKNVQNAILLHGIREMNQRASLDHLLLKHQVPNCLRQFSPRSTTLRLVQERHSPPILASRPSTTLAISILQVSQCRFGEFDIEFLGRTRRMTRALVFAYDRGC